MCGIYASFPGTTQQAATALKTLAHRGKDATHIRKHEHGVLGHVLHALVGEVPQPVTQQGTLLFNGEIYNWKELAATHNIDAENDTDLLVQLLDLLGSQKTTPLLDGVYAYVYLRDNTLTLQRDILGVKPLWYDTTDGIAVASEKKALSRPRELHPRTTLTYDLDTQTHTTLTRPLMFINPETPLTALLTQAVKKRIPENNTVGILFSGGVDSSLLAHLAHTLGACVHLYVAALDDPEKKEPHDLLAARSAAEQLGLELTEVRAALDEVETLLPEVCARIEDSNVIKVGVALPLWLCAHRAAQDGMRVLFSGLGAEEIFAGYQRHKTAQDINQECLRGLRAMHERDLYRDDIVGMSHTLEIRLPLLDHALIGAGLAIPGEEKIVDGIGKIPLRQAAQELGLPQELCVRPKKAAQYGSQFDAAIAKLARRQGQSKSAYLRTLYPANSRLCALLSSGKDSVYALHTMKKLNHEIACAATIIQEDPHSYMYHTPLAAAARLQAQAMSIPYLEERTNAAKEEELAALKEVLDRAVKEHHVNGVVSGALFSNYQRERIERVCEELGLAVHAPLWHLDQEMEVREIIDAGFEFVLVRVAAHGLDKSWLARTITHEDVDVLTQKLGLNVAGEGGEYESLVLNGPDFSNPLVLTDVQIGCEAEGSSPVCEVRAIPVLEQKQC